ncbi:PREDICTED: BAG family molecular chaperone regulator 1-like isoform X1 [Acropora digitifera]|uniref:BAG family molecular chaperone regulator 1-like isoform X1 n=1 Tax=Acropora digitifera TaxID=70779 RepID=UPI00077A8762|nr:PREDICTED: BAG family molecular chaperone regulator 1-like isoform X1 [Acropora digitifera]
MESVSTSQGKHLDMVEDISSLQFTLIHGPNKYPVTFSLSDGENGPTVEDLANLAARLTEVPPSSQRLIFKGQSLTDLKQPLVALGLKNRCKVLLIGKKFDPLEEENMKRILGTEKKIGEVEKKLNASLDELGGIEKGFLQPELVEQSLKKLTKTLKGISEEFMTSLESLDSLVIDPSIIQAKGKRKSLVQHIQLLLDKTDEASSKIESLITEKKRH